MAKSALVIGIARYDKFRNLEKTINDAGAIAEILAQHGNYVIEPLPRKLTPGNENRFELDRNPQTQTSCHALIEQLKTFLLHQAKGKDALIYFAGHGFVVPNIVGKKLGYLAATNSAQDGQNALSFHDFTELIANSELKSLVVLLDCCHAGSLLESSQYQGMQQAFMQKQNYFLMAACQGFERSREGVDHGIFTAVVLAVLRTRVAAGEAVDLDSLFSEVSRKLKQSGQEVVRTAIGGSISLIDQVIVRNEPVIEDISPYVGLEAFTKDTAKFFKGRDRFVRLLLQKLAESNFVPVIGASGSGKSSLVRAGLISVLEAKGNWLILPPIKPGDSPLDPVNEISRILTQLCPRSDTKLEISKAITSGNLEAAIACLPGQEKLLLVVDQFEEVFTVCPEEEARRQFIDLLVGITKHPDSRLQVVTTMRADFFENCLVYRRFGEIIQAHQVLLLPMNEAELAEAIEQPAIVGDYELGEGLLPAILRDVRHEKNILPLLEFALTELWERRENRRLTIATYYALDGVMGALNQRAEGIYLPLNPQEQEWVKRICLMLVRTGQEEKDTRQRRSKSELLGLVKKDDRQGFELALEELVAGRLLVTGKDGNAAAWVDLAHEALMEQWERFAGWREEKREMLRLCDRINDAFKEWAKERDQDKFLLPEGVVTQIEAVETDLADYLGTNQQSYVKQSLYKYKPWLDPKFLRELEAELVDIPAGTFWMGSPEEKGDDDEKPYHKVTVQAFRMGKYTVTQAQWRTVALSPQININLNPTPSLYRGDDLPVEQVSWQDVQEFCARLSKLTGETYRLPSEAEWEYACQAGTETEYCFNNEASELDDYAWYGNNSGNKVIDATSLWQENKDNYSAQIRGNGNNTHPVGEKLPNAWGLYDMHGNVWEWCSDRWHGDYKAKPEELKQNGNKSWETGIVEDCCLLRGGSWRDPASYCRSASRLGNDARVRSNNIGFRVVCVLQ